MAAVLLYTIALNETAFENAVVGYTRQAPLPFAVRKIFQRERSGSFPQLLRALDKVDAVFLDGAKGSL